MFLEFFEELRKRKVPVTLTEWLTLLQAMEKGLHESSLDGFYSLARAILVKDIAHYDAYDDAFLATFKGIHRESLTLASELLDWLRDPRRRDALSEEERRLLEALDPEELRRRFEERLKEQKERHDGGNKWIGTGGTSPFGSKGEHPTGVRIGEGGGRSAMQVAEERRFRAYRNDAVLDVRQIDVALRLLRDLGRDGAPEELDIDETVDRTSRNAGELDIVMRARRRNRLKLILLMDVGGSMDPYSRLVEKLFTAASRNGRFASFRHYYFHNCVYDSVYEDASFRKPVSVADLLHETDREERLVIVGDASMHPGELMDPGGAIYFYFHNRTPGIEWMRRLAHHFYKTAWLNPEPTEWWNQHTIRILRGVFPMFPLTIDGLKRAVAQLVRGAAGGRQIIP